MRSPIVLSVLLERYCKSDMLAVPFRIGAILEDPRLARASPRLIFGIASYEIPLSFVGIGIHFKHFAGIILMMFD